MGISHVPAGGGGRGPAAPARTVARRINGERTTVLGWGAAVLMQLAHPLVAQGVTDHSGFRATPWEQFARFRRTLLAMLSLTFGEPDAAVKTARVIDSIHGRVNGVLTEATGVYPAGTPYSARDPELLRWVHATLVDANLRAYTSFVGPLSPADRDRYCREATWIGPLLGVDPATLPADTGALAAYLETELASGRIAVGGVARRLARDLLSPRAGWNGLVGLPLRLPYRLVTAGMLPPDIRRAYGLRWSPAHAAAVRGWMATSRRTLPLVPDAIRRWPEARALDAQHDAA